MDVVSWLLSKSYVDKTVIGLGAIKGSPATIQSIVDNLDGTHDITFAWKDINNVTHTSVLTVKDGETPTFSSVAITGGHRLTFTTQDPTQSVSFNVMDGVKGDTGISVVASNVDENNNLTLTLSNGNVINAGKIKAVTTVDNTLSTTSANPVENKVITNALNGKVDKENGKGLFSDEEKAKLANIQDGAQVNVIEKLIVNGQEATITDKSIALTLITSAVSNLQNYYLKSETYTKQEVEDLIGSTVGVTIEIVEELPTEGQSNVIYFLPTETEGVYSQYIYSNNSWILIGSTTVDLSNYYTKTQVDTLLNGKQNVMTIDSFPTAMSNNAVASGGVYSAIAQMQPQFQFANMPTASASNLGFVYQYTGATGTYTQNMFYRCVYDDTLGEYKWEEVIFHATVTVDSAISGTSTNPVQNKVIKEALDTKQDIIQYSTMPSAQDNLGKIVQYIGTNTSNYTNGYFYKAIYDSENDVYLWTAIKFSADMLVDNALSTTSENPVQNKVITGAINDIQGVIPSEASSTNQLVDRNSLGTASQKNFTPYVSPDNTDVPISSSVYRAITSAVYGAYHPSGNKTIAELTSDLLIFANIGNVYKITEDGITTDLFIGGAGQTIHTGDNAVVVYGGTPNTFLFDLQSGSIDLTPYQTKELENAIEGQTTVEGALSALSTNSQVTQNEVNDMVNVLGAKNIIPNNAISVTKNGVTFTVNSDGSVTVNGIASAYTQFDLNSGIEYKEGKYTLNGCPSGGGSSTYVIWVRNLAVTIGVTDGGNGATLNVTNTDTFKASIVVYSGATINNLTFYPMIRPASITDDTYVPYSMTNREMTPYVQAISNPNLLDNPWFTINQRNLTTYSAPSSGKRFTVDRWAENYHATVVKNTNGITITSDSSGSNGDLGQTTDGLYSYLVGKLVTASVMLQNGKIYSKSDVLNNNLIGAIRFDLENGFKCDVNTDSSNSYLGFYIYSGGDNANASISIRAVKLELGGVSTLANDTMPNEARELAKCQRYFERNNWYDWGCIRCREAGVLNYGMTYPFLVKKRGVPTFTFNIAGATGIGNGYVYDITDGTSIPTSEVTLQQPSAYNYRMIQVKMNHSSFVVGHDYCLAVGDNVIDISADL